MSKNDDTVDFWPDESLVEHAVKFGAKGKRVFPCFGKKPAFKNNLKLAAKEETIIRGFWRGLAHCNVAIACGPESDLWVLDVDIDKVTGQLVGEQTLRELDAKYGQLPPTVEVITGSGGRHLYWRWPNNGVEIRDAQLRGDVPCLDWRGEGGFVIAPPSIHHKTGRAYCWSVDSANEIAFAPPWLVELVSDRTRARASGTRVSASPPGRWKSLLEGVHTGSSRHDAIVALFGYLCRWREPWPAYDFVARFNQTNCSPPLDQAEVDRITNDVWNLELERRDLDDALKGRT